MRRLEIGPGPERLPGYETLNAVRTPFTDHVGDARKPPFQDATFDEVYSSHCIEHVEWFEVEATIAEWARILKPGGILEVHTVNAAPLMVAMLQWEETGQTARAPGTWKRELHRDHPLLAASGRILNYAKKGEGGTLWMHRAILTPRYLRECFEAAGLVNLEEVAEPKGAKKHRSINIGLRGRKAT
jgi:SAM-dependent methyltransferase